MGETHLNPLKRTSYKEQVARSISWGHYFIFLNILLACLASFAYVYAAPPFQGVLSMFYMIVSWLGHMSFLTVVAYLVLFFPLAFIGNFRYYRVLAVTLASLLHTLLLFDIKIFLMVKVHLGVTALSLIVRELDFDTGLNYNFLFIAIPIVIAFELVFAKITTHSLYKAHHPVFVRSVIAGLFACFISSHILHIWADAVKYEPIITLRSTLPAHYPMTARSFLKSHGWLSEEQLQSASRSDPSMVLSYPISKIHTDEQARPYNLLVVAFNGLSYSNLSADNTPELLKLKQRSQSFEQHYLLYDDELKNLFSMSYGLPLQYRSTLFSQSRVPVIVDEMFKQDFLPRLVVSFPNSLQDEFAQYSKDIVAQAGLRHMQLLHSENDLETLKHAQNQIMQYASGQETRAFSMLVMLNDLKYPSEQGQYYLNSRRSSTTADSNVDVANENESNSIQGAQNESSAQVASGSSNNLADDLLADKDPAFMALYLYEQTLRQIDAQLGIMIKQLDKTHLLDNTVVIVTSLSGDPKLAHSTAFDRKQQHVPLFVIWPEQEQIGSSVNNLSSPQDLVATIASEVLHITTASGNFTLGDNLKHLPEREFLIVDGNDELLILLGKQDTVIYSQDGSSYVERNDKQVQTRPNLEKLIRATRDLNRFLK